MNTLGVYFKWSFDENYDVIWDSYEDGLDYDAWIKENNYWLQNIASDDLKYAIFIAFQVEDFRPGCGGCI